MTDSLTRKFSEDDWQILGDFELSLGPNAAGLIDTQLTKMLEPLHLHTDFLNKILISAREAAMRTGASTASDHVHILIFVPIERASKAGTRGFFRIEKVESVEGGGSNPAHVIEFYLYEERR